MIEENYFAPSMAGRSLEIDLDPESESPYPSPDGTYPSSTPYNPEIFDPMFHFNPNAYNGLFGKGIVAGYNYVAGVVESHWSHATDLQARGYEAAELISSDFYTNRLNQFAFMVTWSPTSYFAGDEMMNGFGGVINNGSLNALGPAVIAGTVGLALTADTLAHSIYTDVTTPRGPSDDLLDIGGSFRYTRSLNTPPTSAGYQFDRPGPASRRFDWR
jgi:hypothetical protein